MHRPAARLTALALLLTAAHVSGCASLTSGSYQDAVARWRVGDAKGATAAARHRYDAVRKDNGLTEAAVAKAAKGALEELEEMPILTKGSRPRVTSKGAIESGSQALVMELRGDMLGAKVTAVIRATTVVRDFGLIGEYPTLLAVVYRREALVDDGGVLVGASPALRSVAAKWAALRVLERFARGDGATRRDLPGER